MRRILLFGLLLAFLSAEAQEVVTMKFVRPSKFQGSGAKIRVSISGNEYILRNGATISINEPLVYYKTVRIDCKYGLGQSISTYLTPKPGQAYEFEVGFAFKGLYIKLVSGEEAKPGESDQSADSVLVDGKWETRLKVDADNLGVGFKAEKVDQSEALRQEWLTRGGKIMYSSVMLTGTYFRLDLDDAGEMDGYGGGVSGAMNWINLKIPEYKTGLSTWNTHNIGIGYDMLVYGFKYSYEASMMTVDVSTVTMSILLNLNLGWTLGLGKFVDEGNWKGVALTLKYKPSINLNYSSMLIEMDSSSPYVSDYTATDSDGDAKFNAGGFGFDLDFSGYSATMDKLVPKPKTKLSFFVLPPIGDNPLFVSVSLGMSIYSR